MVAELLCRQTRSSLWAKCAQKRYFQQRRHLLTLAIETSCDDTSVAVLETPIVPSLSPSTPLARLHFHEKITANNVQYKGISPVESHTSHQANLSTLVQAALQIEPMKWRSKPDFVTVTRGPGFRTSLFTGLDTAKGLAVAWNVPLVGVNHMLGHALAPRLAFALRTPYKELPGFVSEESIEEDHALKSSIDLVQPRFPFLSLLVSGGHTMLLHSSSLFSHRILSETADIAVGDRLDKIGRMVLPKAWLDACPDVSYARELERFVFGEGMEEDSHEYKPPMTRGEEITPRQTEHGWALPVILSSGKNGSGAHKKEMYFSGMDSAVQRILESSPEMSDEERKLLGHEAMRLFFEQMASRVIWALQSKEGMDSINTLVVSGGVAANKFLRTVLRRWLDSRGFGHVRLNVPPVPLCTDNAAMIAWAGMEVFEAGFETSLKSLALNKWSLDPEADDGGIFGAGGWLRRR